MPEPAPALAQSAPPRGLAADREILARHLAGDGDAFGDLVDLLGGPILGYLIRTGLPREDAEDLLQEVFARVHRAAATYQPDRPLKPWVFAIAVNAARTWHRRRRVAFLVRPGGKPVEASPDPHEPTGDELMQARETAAWLEEQIARLPLAQREVVLLCCVQHLDQADAAVALGVPVPTVKTRLRRGRLALLEARRRRTLTLRRETS